MNLKDQAILNDLRSRTLDALKTTIDVSKPVAILDVPGHTNVGDLMIYAGERAYLQQLEVQVKYISDVRRFDADLLRARMPEGTVLIHGGGNLGDIWPEHQAFKEHAALVLQDYPMVQLPQTSFFADSDNSQRANAIFAAHPDYTLMLRDTASIQRASVDLPDANTVFVPDMAFGWTPTVMDNVRSGNFRTVVLARTDKESTESLFSQAEPLLAGEDTVIDWHMNRLERLIYSIGRMPGKLSNGGNEAGKRKVLYPLIESSFSLVTHANLRSGIRAFSTADLVMTDRLHAHVLATLMGIPNIAVDNSYGKVKSLYDDYTYRFSTSNFAVNEKELIEIYRELKRPHSK